MNGFELKRARQGWGFSLEKMATLLGYVGKNRRATVWKIENGVEALREPQRLLLKAYQAGYRPPDWPKASGQRRIGTVKIETVKQTGSG